jgi:hypothetical protein
MVSLAIYTNPKNPVSCMQIIMSSVGRERETPVCLVLDMERVGCGLGENV